MLMDKGHFFKRLKKAVAEIMEEREGHPDSWALLEEISEAEAGGYIMGEVEKILVTELAAFLS